MHHLPMFSQHLHCIFIIAILCRLYDLALYAGTLIDKQYVIIVSVFCIMIVVIVCY